MKLIVNGEKIENFSATLEGLCHDLNYEKDCIATAVNGIFVPKEMRICTVLYDGDTIEILVPLQGG